MRLWVAIKNFKTKALLWWHTLAAWSLFPCFDSFCWSRNSCHRNVLWLSCFFSSSRAKVVPLMIINDLVVGSSVIIVKLQLYYSFNILFHQMNFWWRPPLKKSNRIVVGSCSKGFASAKRRRQLFCHKKSKSDSLECENGRSLKFSLKRIHENSIS